MYLKTPGNPIVRYAKVCLHVAVVAAEARLQSRIVLSDGLETSDCSAVLGHFGDVPTGENQRTPSRAR